MTISKQNMNRNSPMRLSEPSMRLIAREEPEEPSVGSTTYWSGNSHSRMVLYSLLWAGSEFSIVVNHRNWARSQYDEFGFWKGESDALEEEYRSIWWVGEWEVMSGEMRIKFRWTDAIQDNSKTRLTELPHCLL